MFSLCTLCEVQLSQIRTDICPEEGGLPIEDDGRVSPLHKDDSTQDVGKR